MAFTKPEFFNVNRDGFNLSAMGTIVQSAYLTAKKKLSTIQAAGSSVSIGNMFDMQMLMNRLSQYSEMSSAVISAANSAVSSMARNIK